jgi:hypothetical protein
MVDKKRLRYPAGIPGVPGDLVPLVLEANGRPCDETIAFVRNYGHGLGPEERSQVISMTWRRASRLLQFGNAEMILSAVGK